MSFIFSGVSISNRLIKEGVSCVFVNFDVNKDKSSTLFCSNDPNPLEEHFIITFTREMHLFNEIKLINDHIFLLFDNCKVASIASKVEKCKPAL